MLPSHPLMTNDGERKVPVATHKRPTYTHINSSTLTHNQSCTAYTMRDIYHTMQTYRQKKKKNKIEEEKNQSVLTDCHHGNITEDDKP